MTTSEEAKTPAGTAAVITELKLILSKLILCLIQSDFKQGRKYLNCTDTESVTDVSENIQHKITIFKNFLASIQRLCKHLNLSCTKQTSPSHKDRLLMST